MKRNIMNTKNSLQVASRHRPKRKRRTVYDIYADILKESMELLIPYRIAGKAGLNFNNFTKHLKFLIDNRLIEPVKKHGFFYGYRTTEKGKEYMAYYKSIKGLTNNNSSTS